MAQTEIQTSQDDSQPDAPAQAPERPQLADGVELSGAMEESGFADRQWLVQRDGQFIQLTELLYRVLQEVNGERTLAEIAAALSEGMNRRVGAADVRQLVERKLIPLGLVVAADGSVVERGQAGGQGAARSPLSINMRTRVVSPGLIAPVSRAFGFLYWPPVLVVMLLVSALAQIWLFFIHGIAHSVYQVLYQPGYMLLLLGIIVVATAFHELGHATALQYGGGRVRGMGVGLYLVYPAFYTDVTDNYRLGRWARVRTDLGGFYFNLIFALLMLGLYALTKFEFLLLVVVFVDLEIVQQTLPFVRLDGYWALADLTGIPDFFSQVVPFLRTVTPLPFSREGRKLPDLKGWVKAVFTAYIAITVPLLLLMFGLMVEGVPRVLATTWDSSVRQSHALSAAAASGNVLGIAASLIQMALLALPAFGTVYILYNLARRLARMVWTWSRPTAGRRAIGAMGTAAVLALLAWLWLPQLPFGGNQHSPYAAWRPIGAQERGTLDDALRNFPFVTGIVSSTPDVARGDKHGETGVAASGTTPPPQSRPHGGTFLDAARGVPVLGGIVHALAPSRGTILDNVRGVPIVGGVVGAIAPRHGTFADTMRSVPVLGGIVNHVVPPVKDTSRSAPSLEKSGSSGASFGHSAPVGQSGSNPGSTSGAGSATQGGQPTSGTQGNQGVGPLPVPTDASGVVETPVAGVSGTVNGAVQTPISGVSGTVNGVVQTPVAGVSGTVHGVVGTPVAGVSGTVNRAAGTPVAGVAGTAGRIVGTPVAGAAGAVTGAVKTPVSQVTGKAGGAVQTPVSGVTGKVGGVVQTPVASLPGGLP